MTPTSPRIEVPPELLDRDRLGDLLDLLRSHRKAEAIDLDLAPAARLMTPLLQLLAAARRDNLPLRLTGLTLAQRRTLRALDLETALALPEGAA